MLYPLTVIISLLLVLFLLLRSDVIQTVAARMGAEYLTRELNTECRIRGFSLSLSKGLLIQDISILDHRGGVRRLGRHGYHGRRA